MSLSLSSRIAALSWAAFAAAPFAIGQDAPPPLPEDSVPITKLDTTVVTASREEEEAIEAPYLVERITEAELVERAARTLPEALERVPGVIVQKTAHSQGSPIIRGLTGYHNLVLIDGVRLNDATFRSGPNEYWNTVDSQGLRAIELVKSQGSVLFGSDAVGGTLQALTRRPAYADGAGIHIGGRSYSRYATAEDGFIQRGEISFSEAGRFGVLLGGSYKDFGNIDAAGLGRLPHTGYEEWAADGKLEFFPTENSRLTIFHQQLHQDGAWRVHKTTSAVPWRGTEIGDERTRMLENDRLLTYIQLEGDAQTALFDHYKVSLSHQRHSEGQYRIRGNGRIDNQGLDLDSYGAWAQFDRDLEFTDLIYGFSYYQDRVDSFRDDYNADGSLRAHRIQGPVGDDGTYHLADFFFNTSTPVGDRLVVDLGARYTYAEAEIGSVEDTDTGEAFSINDSWDHAVASGRASYRLDDAGEWRLFGGISQAFRAPNFSDLSRLDSNRSSEIETPSPGLGPEKFVTYEIGVKTQSDRFGAELSYYYTDISDLILRTPTGRVVDGLDEVIKSNVGDGYVHGVELSGSFEICDGLTLFGGFAWQESSVSTYPTSEPDLVDEPLSRLLPTSGYGGARFEFADGRAWIETQVTAAARADRLSSSDVRDTQRIPPGGTPGYWIATLRGGCRVTDNILLTAGVENIFDEEYRAHGSGQNEPGTNFVFGAEIRF